MKFDAIYNHICYIASGHSISCKAHLIRNISQESVQGIHEKQHGRESSLTTKMAYGMCSDGHFGWFLVRLIYDGFTSMLHDNGHFRLCYE